MTILFLGFILLNIIVYFSVTYPHLYRDYEVEIEDIESFNTFIFADSHGWRLSKGNPGGDQLLRKEGIYNFSYGSDSYPDIYLKLKWMIDNGVKPKKIIISADRHLLSKKRELNNNLNRSIYYAKATDYKEFRNYHIIHFYLRKYIKYLPILNTSNSKLVKESLYANLNIKNDEFNDENLKWSNLSSEEQLERSIRKRDDHFPSKKKSLNAEKTLIKIFELCEVNDIEVNGITFPIANTYLNLIDDINLGTMEVFDLYNIQVLELEDYFVQHDEYFDNQDHVNAKGADLIIKDIVKNKN